MYEASRFRKAACSSSRNTGHSRMSCDLRRGHPVVTTNRTISRLLKRRHSDPHPHTTRYTRLMAVSPCRLCTASLKYCQREKARAISKTPGREGVSDIQRARPSTEPVSPTQRSTTKSRPSTSTVAWSGDNAHSINDACQLQLTQSVLRPFPSWKSSRMPCLHVTVFVVSSGLLVT